MTACTGSCYSTVFEMERSSVWVSFERKVIPINEELARKLDELALFREDKAYFNQKFDEAHQQAEEQYSSVFTPEQLTTFKAMQERNRERRQQVRE